jgi:CheY-like chemotaxis protein
VEEPVTDAGAAPADLAVCIVDDDVGIRETLRFLLEEEGYEVEEASDGAAALRLLESQPRPRVMLLDRMMPRLSGLQTLRALVEASDLAQRTIVLFMSARSDEPEPQERALIQSVAFATAIKPFDLYDLLATVERAVATLAQRLGAE